MRSSKLIESFSHYLASKLSIPLHRVSPDLQLNQLGINSFLLLEFAFEIQIYLGVEWDDLTLSPQTTLREIAHHILTQVTVKE